MEGTVRQGWLFNCIEYKPTEMMAERMNNNIFLIEDKNTLYELLPLFENNK